MSSLKIGALFAGYGGLDMAVMDVLDAELAWYAEFDKAPAKVMAHHHPDVPNLWDVTKVDWSAVEPVDIITGGSPCQDLSHAGKRKGMTDGTRSNLWAEMREAIATHRPRLVVWENVRGAGSAEATSSMEQCPRCVGDPRDRGPVLRALGRVVGDLADLGYVGRFYGLRATDVGGAHGRFRYFVIASPADANTSGLGAVRDGGARWWESDPGGGTVRDQPTGRRAHGEAPPDSLSLLPTPAASENGGNRDIEHRRAAGSQMELSDVVTIEHEWRQYVVAIRRAELAVGRPAPSSTETGPKGKPRLSPAFVEWLMMLPAGHVTNPAIGITRNEQLKALGNGVVPPQAAAALRAYLRDEREAVA